jgi:hypothetical protein
MPHCVTPRPHPETTAVPGLYDRRTQTVRLRMCSDVTAAQARPGRLGRLTGAVRSIFGLALGVALPQLCAACREPVAGEGLCAACWSKLSFIAPPYCERLGIPFPFDPGPVLRTISSQSSASLRGRSSYSHYSLVFFRVIARFGSLLFTRIRCNPWVERG